MAIGDISALAPDIQTLGTTAGGDVIATVPANEEWTIRWMRAVCLIASGGTPPTVSVRLTSACNELCFNEVVPIPTASVSGAKNVIGPDFITLPAGTQIYARASAPSAVRLSFTGTRKQVA